MFHTMRVAVRTQKIEAKQKEKNAAGKLRQETETVR